MTKAADTYAPSAKFQGPKRNAGRTRRLLQHSLELLEGLVDQRLEALFDGCLQLGVDDLLPPAGHRGLEGIRSHHVGDPRGRVAEPGGELILSDPGIADNQVDHRHVAIVELLHIPHSRRSAAKLVDLRINLSFRYALVGHITLYHACRRQSNGRAGWTFPARIMGG